MRSAIVSAAQESAGAQFSEVYADMLMRTCGLSRSINQPGSVLAATALQPVLEEIADTVASFLRDLPDDLGCEVIDSGICLTGGGALIPGVRDFFEKRTGICVTTASNPRASVVEGARVILPIVLMLNQWK